LKLEGEKVKRIILSMLICLSLWPLMADAGEYRQFHAEWEHTDSGSNINGFRIYYQDNIVCETYEPTARRIDCEVFITGYPASFTATAYDLNGNESVHSSPYLLQQPVSNAPPEAVIAANSSAGKAPHTVNLDASGSYDSDGRIIEYTWNFGDGQTGSGLLLSHTYQAAGNYTITLSVTDDKNATSEAQTTITVTAPSPTGSNIPPSAIIAVSPQEGQAPLMARFDALDSTAPSGKLVNFNWEFGDGTSGRGETINHIYTSPGTYTVKLTVTDSHGASAKSQVVLSVRENTSTAAGFAFNFQPADAQVQEGYVVDSGAGFNQLTGFGWTSSPGTMGPRLRNSSHSPDQAHDTFIHVDPGGVWELAVPNGHYLVTVCTGDPAHPEGLQHVRVEGVPVIDNILSDAERWLERQMVVSVQDERLTLTFEGSSPLAKLAWVRIEHPSAWRPALNYPRNGAVQVRTPVQFNWSTPPASPHLTLGSPVTYTLYYGTDPRLEPVDMAAGPSANGILLAGAFLFGGAGLATRRQSGRLLLALPLMAGLFLLPGCSGDDFLLLPGKMADTRVVDRLNSDNFQADDLQPGTTYYWKVVASDGEQQVESKKFSFTTE
jgi:PKD repeat protein